MRIIVVEDEPVILHGMKMAIERTVPDAEVQAFSSSVKALASCREQPADVAFLDIEMPEISGMELARQLREANREINIIFTTSYAQYALDAHQLRASGYLLKPVSDEDIRQEMENLRYIPKDRGTGKLRMKTFGTFEAFVGQEHLRFRYSKTLELLAYLTDRNGAFCTNGELVAILWENSRMTDKVSNYLRQLRKDLIDTLQDVGCNQAVEQQRGKICLKPERVECDYFDFLQGKAEAAALYKGEYMSQYSWAEITNGWLNQKMMSR